MQWRNDNRSRPAGVVFLAGVLLCAAVGVGRARPDRVSLDLEPRRITVGDRVEMTLKVEAGPDETVIWPPPELFAPIEVLSFDTLSQRGAERAIQYIVTLFEPGRVELPDLPVIITRAEGADTLWVDPGVIEVASVLSPTDSLGDIREVHPPVPLAWTFKDVLPYLVVGLVLVVLATGVFLLVRRRRRRRGELPKWTPPPPPPYEIAMRRLTELKEKRLWQSGYLKEFHSELTEIVKAYIGARFGFNALEMTTEELLDRGARWSTDREQYISVRRILTCADLVKFAKFKPDPRENDGCLEAAFGYVKATKPTDETAVDAVEAGSATVGAES